MRLEIIQYEGSLVINLPEQSSTLSVGIFENKDSDGNIDSQSSNVPRITFIFAENPAVMGMVLMLIKNAEYLVC
jgi:hypothetical protein